MIFFSMKTVFNFERMDSKIISLTNSIHNEKETNIIMTENKWFEKQNHILNLVFVLNTTTND